MTPFARRIPWPVIALAVFVLVWALDAGGHLARLEFHAADTRSQLLRREVASDIVIVGIDADSLAELNEWPWPRRHHARLLEQLAQAGPARVFLDIDFSSRSNPVDDGALRQALAAWPGPPVILPSFVQPASGAGGPLVATQPLPELLPHVELVSVNQQLAADGLVRTMRGSWRGPIGSPPSIAALLADHPLAPEDEFPIDFSIAPDSFAFYSYSDVLSSRVPPARLVGKEVFVGATATELNDTLPVPVFKALPGVAVQALATETLRNGGLAALPGWLATLLLAGWVGVQTGLFAALSWRRNLLLLIVGTALIALASVYAYAAQRLVIDAVPPMIAGALAFVAITIRSLDEQTLRALAYALGLRRRDALLQSIVDSTTDCILGIDSSGRIQTANPAAARLFRCRPAELTGASISRFVPALFEDSVVALDALTRPVSEWDALTLSGDPFPVELSISRVRLDDETLYTTIVRDISERKAQQLQLQHQATHDPLTALPNRTALAEHLERVLAANSSGRTVALLMLDLCRFKEVNDTLGHDIGDRVLCEVAQRFEQIAGSRGFIARIGGDEFTVVLDDLTGSDCAAQHAQSFEDGLRAPIRVGGITIDLGLSIGIAIFPQDAADAQTLLRHADVAMYVAKRRGTTYEYYDPEHDGHSVRRLSMVGELRRAIESGQLELHFQPQIDLRSGRAESAEALLRWQHPSLGVVSPAEFISLAETTDLIEPLTEWTLTQALATQGRWRSHGQRIRIAVNLSARLLQDADFPQRLAAQLRSSGTGADALELEVTESAMLQEPARAMAVLEAIHELGVPIAVDDYGTGFSSLQYLRDLPVHALKLDKSFVMNMRTRADDRIIVESTVQMAHGLGLVVVAEGVETRPDADLLAACGCDFAQGYLYAPALPAEQCRVWIEGCNAPARRRA